MKSRDMAALALLLLASCSTSAAQRAEASRQRAEASAASAEKSAMLAAKARERVQAAENSVQDSGIKANDLQIRWMDNANCSHGYRNFAGEKNTCKPLSPEDWKSINARVKALNPNLK